jgi:microcystin-dependent protein
MRSKESRRKKEAEKATMNNSSSKRTGWGWVLGIAVFAMNVSLGLAQTGVPDVINYQGRLYNPSGAGSPLTGVQQVQFRIWDSLTGGTLIWGRQFPVSCTEDGIFNVLLNDGGTWLAGATNKLQGAFQGSTRFLELTVVGYGGAIAPRQQLVSAPYAMQAAYAVDATSATKGFSVAGGPLTASGGATVIGTATFDNNVEVKGNALLDGTLQVKGASTMDGKLHVKGNVTVDSPSFIGGYGTIPIGGIILWSGAVADIPDGWALCNGTSVNGHATPDLRGRFVAGAGGAYAVGHKDGADSVTLTTAQLPAHGHDFHDAYYIESYTPKHSPSGGGSDHLPSEITGSQGTDHDNKYVYWRANATANAGSGASHENRPSFYALCYLMRVK